MIRLEDVSVKDMTKHYFCGAIDNCQALSDFLVNYNEKDIMNTPELSQLKNYLSVIDYWLYQANLVSNYTRMNNYFKKFRSFYDTNRAKEMIDSENFKITDAETSAKILLYDNPFNPFYDHIKFFNNKSVSDIKHMLLEPDKYKEFDFIDLFSLNEALHIYEDAVIRIGKEKPNYKGNLLKANYLYRLCLLNKNFQKCLKLLDIDEPTPYLFGYLTKEEAKLITGNYPECDFIETLKDKYFGILLNNLSINDYTNKDCISNDAIKRIRIK